MIKFERNYMHWLLAALFAVMCLLAGLFILLRRIRLQEEALSKAWDTTHAIADLFDRGAASDSGGCVQL